MSQFEAADNTVAKTAMSAYVPPLQRTEGQPSPIAAHGGLSYMSFDQNGDAGTAVAIQTRSPRSPKARARWSST